MILFPRSSVSDQSKQSRRKLFPFLAPSNAHASSSRSQKEPLPRKSKKKLFFTAKIHSSLGNSIKFCLETGGSNAVGEATCRRSKMERKKKGEGDGNAMFSASFFPLSARDLEGGTRQLSIYWRSLSEGTFFRSKLGKNMTSRKTRWIIRLEFPWMNDELMTSSLEKVFSISSSSPRGANTSRWRILCSTLGGSWLFLPKRERRSMGLINSDRRNENLERSQV